MPVFRQPAVKLLRVIGRRYASAQKLDLKTADIRNIAVVAHIDSGKTTLTESILVASHYLSTPGSVDTGSTITDFLPAERERGITIQSASIPVKWNQYIFNLIDTPGHADFGMEVESASRVVDGAVVLLDSVEGVEAQTKGVWRQLDRYGVRSRLMFLNKLDRPGASLHTSFLSVLENRLHPNPVILTLPVASFHPKDYSLAEPGISGLVDLVKWEVWKWDGSECRRVSLSADPENLSVNSPFPPSHPLLSQLVVARAQLLESLSMLSEEFMNILLGLPSGPPAYLSLGSDIIVSHLRALTLQQEILPIICGSALRHVGTEILLDYVAALLPSPLDYFSSEEISNHGQVQILAWKVSWDKRKGWMTFVRVYSGVLNKQATLFNSNRGQRERATKILLLYASQPQEVDSLPCGAVGVLLGLRHTRTGDTLVSSSPLSAGITGATLLQEITAPPAVVSASVIPTSHSDLQPVQESLSALSRTDPSARFEEQDGQLLVHGLGALHLEIIEGRLRGEWEVNFRLGKRKVSYREGYDSAEICANRAWETQIGGQTVQATLSIRIRALQSNETGVGSWGGNVVVDGHGASLPSPDVNHAPDSLAGYLVQGLSSALSNSYHTGLPLTHLHLTVYSYQLSATCPPSVLTGASAQILRGILREAGAGPLMEPYVRLKVEVSEEHIGKVVKDITEHQGEILDLGASSSIPGTSDYVATPYPHDGLYVPPAWLTPCSAPSTENASRVLRLKRSIHSVAPLSQMLDYSNRLRALSGGHGVFEMFNEGYRKVTDARKHEILKELGRL